MSGVVLPTVMTKDGLAPIPPATLLALLTSLVAATNPDYTNNLPPSLIGDVAGTDVGAVTLINQAQVESVNCITPRGANEFVLTQQGAIYGVQQGIGSNTSVLLTFSSPQHGFPIVRGFTVSDGAHQYTVQDGGVVGASGTTAPLFALATVAGSWAVPANTVTQLITSLPPGVTVTVTNLTTGIPGAGAQSPTEYRAQVLQAGLAVSQGMATRLRTDLQNVPGVQARLISIVQQPAAEGGGWEIIVGGGDPYAVADAIWTALQDPSTIVGSVLGVTSITQANPGVVTTDKNHGYTTNEQIRIENAVGMTDVNNVLLTITVLTPTTFSIGLDTSTFTPYTGAGFCTPNPRNETVTIQDFPDSYPITFVIPPQQTVAIELTWNTTFPNFVNPDAVAQQGIAALVTYVNSIYVGQPMNLFELQTVFQAAVATLVPPQQLTRMVFSVSIDGVGVLPAPGTGIIAGDPESFLLTNTGLVTVVQG